MKYRIIKVETDKIYFIIQEKKWYGWKTLQRKKWHGWKTLQGSGCGGWDIYYYDRKFLSEEEAEKFIATSLIKPKLAIIKEIVLLLVLCCFSSCYSSSDTKYLNVNCEVMVTTIDNCEYIVAQTGTYKGGVSIIHKQNCKYCEIRSK